MSKPAGLSIDWGAHPRCRQCDKLFEVGLPRAAAIVGLKIDGVFHVHCWPKFEAALGSDVHTIVPYPVGPTRRPARLAHGRSRPPGSGGLKRRTLFDMARRGKIPRVVLKTAVRAFSGSSSKTCARG